MRSKDLDFGDIAWRLMLIALIAGTAVVFGVGLFTGWLVF